jgi:methylated-DNA-[protein]-cysteine S-methyltransferase
MNTATYPEDDARWLERLIPVDTDTLDRMHARLAARAEQEGLLDIAYRAIDAPVGRLLLAATDQGLLRVAYEREDHDRVLERLAKLISPRIMRAPRRLDPAVRQIDEYFAAERTNFDLPLDLRLSHGFRREVLARLSQIRYGTTESYRQVAQATGHPQAVRAVGSACATNPLPVVIPCHRVVRSDGSLGGYLGGLDAKRILLTLEAGG